MVWLENCETSSIKVRSPAPFLFGGTIVAANLFDVTPLGAILFGGFGGTTLAPFCLPVPGYAHHVESTICFILNLLEIHVLHVVRF